MFGFRRAAKIGNAAHVPQQLHPFGADQAVDHFWQVFQRLQRQNVIGIARAGQPVVVGRGFQTADQPVNTAKLKRMVAPVEFSDRLKLVGFNGLDHLGVKRAGLTRDTERAVLQIAPGAARDLGQFLRIQGAHPAAVKFGGGGKGDVFDVKIKPHADGIGGDKVIDITVLIQSDLRVAGPGRKRPHDHSTPALLAFDQFGNGIDIFNRKPHDGGAWWHPAYLFRTCIGQLRKPLAL